MSEIATFDPSKTYGEFLTVSDKSMWKEMARLAAAKHIPSGTEILVGLRESTVAWRYPANFSPPAQWEADKIKV